MSQTINKEMLRLAIPNIISNLSVPFLSTVDTILMGQLSALHLAAVGISSMIFNFFYWNFGFLRMGTTGMTAQAFGMKDNISINQILYRALILSVVIAIILMVFNDYVLQASSYLLNVDNSYASLVNEYFKIRILAAPATLSLYALMGWYFGMQNAWIPMIVTILINMLNIIVSYIFVQYWGMGIGGVAWGTVIAQYIGLLTALIFLYNYKKELIRIKWKNIFDLSAYLKFMDVNKDIFIRTVCLTFAFAFFYRLSADAGVISLAVMVVLLQFLNWMSYFIDGFAYAAESLVGKYYGARNYLNLKISIKYSIYWGLFLAICFSLIYYIFKDPLLSIFTNDEMVISKANELMKWTIIMPIAGFLAYIWDGVFIGLTRVKEMRNSMLVSLAIYLGLIYFVPLESLDWYWIAFLIFLFARGIIQSYQYFISIDNEVKIGIEND